MPWTKRTAPKSRAGRRASYERHTLYLNWDRGSAFVRVPVPLALRKRFTRNTVARYLGTRNATEAKKLAPAAIAAVRAEFAAMERQNTLTADAAQRIQSFETWKTHAAMVTDPLTAKSAGEIVDFGTIEQEAKGALLKLGLDPSPRNLSAAMDALYAGKIGATVLWDQGITPPQPAPLRLLDAPSDTTGGTIVEAVEEYCTAPKSAVDVTDKTRHQVRQSARLFGDHLDGLSVGAVTRKHAVGFLDRLAAISPAYRHDPNAAKMTLAELEAKYPAVNGDGLSAKTLNRHATALRTIFERLKARDVLSLDHPNPFTQTHRKAGDDTYQSMRDEEIAALVKAATLATDRAVTFNDAVGWLVALAAYTGARAGELLALTKADVLRKGGISFVAIAKGKTKNARRFVPLHSKLIAAGFLKYVAKSDDGKLFGIDAATLAKRFPTFRRDHGVTRDKVTFHSLRKSFVSKLEHAGFTGDQIAPLVGHAGGQRSFTLDVYSPDGPTLNQRALVVEKIEYKGVKLA
jgi:integrase